jgi:hypothetical protein
LELKLESLSVSIGQFGLLFAICTFIALMVRMVMKLAFQNEVWQASKHPMEIIRAVMISVPPKNQLDYNPGGGHTRGIADGGHFVASLFSQRNAQRKQLSPETGSL